MQTTIYRYIINLMRYVYGYRMAGKEKPLGGVWHQMKVVQVGYGYWGANISKKLVASPKFEFKALCEILPDRAAKARRELPDEVEICDNYENYLDDKEVEAFVVATQTVNTFDIGMKAMAAGKHVFMEKPLATTVERSLKLMEQAKKYDSILHCDHIMLYNPYYGYIKKIYDEGELGDLMYFDVRKLNLGPIRKDVDALMDLAVHDVAVIDWLSGGKEPVKLSAIGHIPFGEHETHTYLTMEYDGFVAHLHSSWMSPLKIRQTIVGGTKKTVIFDDMAEQRVKVYDCGINVQEAEAFEDYIYTNRRDGVYLPQIEFEDSLQNSLEFFAECVRTHTQSPSGPEPSLRVMKVLEWAEHDMKPAFRNMTK